MARKVENDKNIPVIEMSVMEAYHCGIGPLCDNCNELFFMNENTKLYYIPSLNMIHCEDCYNKFINSPLTKHYDEDTIYEKIHFNHYAKQLNLQEI